MTKRHEPLHAVELYDDDQVLLDQLADYVQAGRDRGERTVVVATPERRQALSRRFAEGEEAFIGLDAAATLERFMIGGLPDPELFEESVGSLIRSQAEAGVRAYGEMVALLWAEDNAEGTLQLEELWNGLQAEVEFPLLCGYPVAGFADGVGLEEVCERHTHVGLAEEPDSARKTA